ncbi:MAG: hypothetical protein GTO14_13460 [Anaerolineales bacterium]|nr:hypothetical protein [Anaerolineales bacterium]
MSIELAWAIQIGSGILWTLTYLLIIKRGFQDRTYGMPLPALAANLSWEFIFAFILPHGNPQIYINIAWFIFDVIILYQALRFGPATFGGLLGKWFYPAFVIGIITAFGAVLSVTFEFQDWEGKYAAFGQNLMMSILFNVMLFRRTDVKGQSMYIAIFKMLGTLLASILFYIFYPSSPLLNFLFVTILFFDCTYIVLLYRKHRECGVNLWRRV